jgi:hypothetical protein
MGAAAAALPISEGTPQLAQEVQRVGNANGGTVTNPDALARQIRAESIGGSLTEGQAAGDAERISNELNNRAQNPEHVRFFRWQNGVLTGFLQRLRDAVTDETGARAINQTDHGEALIQAYRDMDDTARTDIDARYAALRNAHAQYMEGGGSEMAINAQQLLDNVKQALSNGHVDPETGERLGGMLGEFANSKIMTQLQNAAKKGGMSFEQYEAMRTNLAKLMRGASDPLERASSHVIRSVMEDMPLAQDIQELKGLADEARGAARSRFDRIEADPAYEAVVSGTADPGKFTRQFLFGPRASREGAATMLENLSDNEMARGHMTAAALDHLRDQAIGQGGVFSQAGFNRALRGLDAQRNSLFTPTMQEYLERLG